MPQSRTHQDPEPLARTTGAESVARNAHGQSLDEARETFRTEWQAKIDRKREHAVKARRLGADIFKAPKVLVHVIPALGAMAVASHLEKSLGWPGLLLGAFAGAAVGYAAAALAIILDALACSMCFLYAGRIEQAAKELERS